MIQAQDLDCGDKFTVSRFIMLDNPPHKLRVREDMSARLVEVLIRGEGCVAVAGAGRGAVERFPIHGGFGVLRRYRRGGLLAGVLQDRFFCNRMQAEFDVHVGLERAGAPVPPLLGVCWARSGMAYRGAIATRFVEAPTLSRWLSSAKSSEPVDALRACGAAIRRIHDLGVYHADLNAANILMSEEGPIVIDFDGARRYERLSRRGRAANLLRLRRSLRKAGHADTVFETILEGYGGFVLPRGMLLLDALRCRLRGHSRQERGLIR